MGGGNSRESSFIVGGNCSGCVIRRLVIARLVLAVSPCEVFSADGYAVI
jgi:hypothetical protein